MVFFTKIVRKFGLNLQLLIRIVVRVRGLQGLFALQAGIRVCAVA